ncbi:MAG: tubulin-like doman-containing protein [Paludibaculum sp.]
MAGDSDISSINFNVQWERNQHKSIQGPPYNAVYLLENTNEADVSIGLENRRDLFTMLAECLFLDLLPGSFADAKRSDYSNIVTRLSGPEGANSVSGGVSLMQMFSRRYASCGLSKIEIPMDSVRGACGATLAAEILGYILRDREDALVAKSVRDGMANQSLDADGIPALYTEEWKNQVRRSVAELFQGVDIKKPADIDSLKLALEKLNNRLLGVDGSKSGDVIKWFRQRTGSVSEDARRRATTLLQEQCLENDDRGLLATIRKGGYLDLALDQTKALHSPEKEGVPAVFDRKRQTAEEDAKDLTSDRDRYLTELNGALGSIPVVVLGAKLKTIRILLNRIRDNAEQALLAKAEAWMYGECKKVAVELEATLKSWHANLNALAGKVGVAHASAMKRREEFVKALDSTANLLFARYFSMGDDWPVFYKLGIDKDTASPAEVDPENEYRNLLKEWSAPSGLLDLAATFDKETEEELGRRLQKYCEEVFGRDFAEHERPISLYDRPAFRDPVARKVMLQNLVRRARPMLRQGTLGGRADNEIPRFAYLGLYTHNPRTPEEQSLIDEIQGIVRASAGPSYRLDIQPLDRPYEMYLYFSNYAFSAPSLPVVKKDCHEAYADFYTELMSTPTGTPLTSIPLHLSKLWEGKFDDLEEYSDVQAKLLVQSLTILLFGVMLKVIHPEVEKTQVMYKYKLGAPFNTLERLGNRRHLITRLMNEHENRAMFLTAINQREASLTKEQAISYFWAITAALSEPEMMPALPEHKLLSDKLSLIYDLALAKGADKDEVDSGRLRISDRFQAIRTDSAYRLDWPVGNLPVVRDIDEWSKGR